MITVGPCAELRQRRGAGPGAAAGRSGCRRVWRETIQVGPVTETVALFNAGTGAYHRLGPDHAAVAHDRARLDDTAAADVAAVDHRHRCGDAGERGRRTGGGAAQ